MSATSLLQSIVDRHTEQRIGLGEIPVTALYRTITLLYECGRPIPDIAKALEIGVGDVMEALGVDYYCAGCGMAADLGGGVPEDGYWATACCGDMFISRRGNEYCDDPRWFDWELA